MKPGIPPAPKEIAILWGTTIKTDKTSTTVKMGRMPAIMAKTDPAIAPVMVIVSQSVMKTNLARSRTMAKMAQVARMAQVLPMRMAAMQCHPAATMAKMAPVMEMASAMATVIP